jgi:hypothetical protein
MAVHINHRLNAEWYKKLVRRNTMGTRIQLLHHTFSTQIRNGAIPINDCNLTIAGSFQQSPSLPTVELE